MHANYYRISHSKCTEILIMHCISSHFIVFIRKFSTLKISNQDSRPSLSLFTTFLDVVKTILKVMGRQDLSIEIKKNNSKDIGEDIEFLSNFLAKSKLGWTQEIPLEKGISLSIAGYKKIGKL